MSEKSKISALRRFLGKQKFVRFAYVFGSHARRDTGPLSDIDIAVYLDEKLNKNKSHEKELFLINEISGILGTDKFDIVILNNSRLLLNFNIIRDGVVLKSNVERIRFEKNVMGEYMDREYHERIHADIGLKRISRRGLS